MTSWKNSIDPVTEPAMTKGEYDALRDSDVRPWPTPVQHLLAAILEEPDDDWRSRAACHPDNRTTPTEAEWTALWYPENGNGYRDARAICAGCPVRAECKADGADELFGMWGGEGREQRELARSTLPPMTRHGYPFGAQAHRRRGETPCDECMNVQRQYETAYRARRRAKRAAA